MPKAEDCVRYRFVGATGAEGWMIVCRDSRAMVVFDADNVCWGNWCGPGPEEAPYGFVIADDEYAPMGQMLVITTDGHTTYLHGDQYEAWRAMWSQSPFNHAEIAAKLGLVFCDWGMYSAPAADVL